MKNLYVIFFVLLFSACNHPASQLTILHTNDTHSCITAEKDGGAGVLNRALLIEQIADSVGRDNILLFDCGDFSQGSLFYNIFKGEIEIKMMNAMWYDACTIGNHEFDFGLENMARLFAMAEFPVVCANYDFTGTACEGLVKPYVVIRKGGRRIGVFGLSPALQGLVAKENYAGVRFISPLLAAKDAVDALKTQGCDVIICLSHLGWQMPGEYNDEILATSTSGIDVILGGHSHNYFEQPVSYMNRDGESVLVQQMGKNGRYLGWVNLTFK